MHVIVETEMFLRAAKLTGVSDEEREGIVSWLAANPTAGDVIQGTGGVRKARIAAKGKGKSGGYRVITFFGGNDMPLFLLTIYAKGDRADLSPEMRKAVTSVAEIIKQEFHRPWRKKR
ncbi:MAG: addiction module toxin RelE [Proteobacteria bacterium]|jgi:hypothetical protein|nr:MAG: addiction module toxin RelE [Pseudomonadota bacterium]